MGFAWADCDFPDLPILDLPFNNTYADQSPYGTQSNAGGGAIVDDRFGNPSSAVTGDATPGWYQGMWNPGAWGEVTFAGWFKPTVAFDGGTARQIITSHDFATHQVYYQSGNFTVELYDGTHSVSSLSVTTDFPADAWVHYVVTATAGGAVTIYLDNVANAAGTAPAEFDATAGVLYLGAQSDGNYAFTGLLDDLSIWDVALDAAGIDVLFNATE